MPRRAPNERSGRGPAAHRRNARNQHRPHVYFNAENLTNTALNFTAGAGDNRVIQREFYGVTLQAGFNYKL